MSKQEPDVYETDKIGSPEKSAATVNALPVEGAKETVKRKPGLRAGFGKQLTERIDTIEEIIASQNESLNELHRKIAQLTGNLPVVSNGLQPQTHVTLGQSSGSPASFSYVEKAEGGTKAETGSQVTSSVHSISPQTFGEQTLQRQTTGNSFNGSQVYPMSASPSDLQMPSKKRRLNEEEESHQNKAQEADEPALTLLTPEIVKSLVDAYFDRIHPYFPILHREKTKSYLFEASGNQKWPLLLYAIIAITSRFLPKGTTSSEMVNKIYNDCKDRVILHSLNITTVERLQALVVLAMDMAGRSNGPPTWGIMALISAGAIHLGICREESSLRNSSDTMGMKGAELLTGTTDFMEQEARRRLFWGIYMLDKFSSVATTFSFKLNESEIDRMLPVRESLWKSTAQANGDSLKTKWLRTSTRKDYQLCSVWTVDYFGYLMEILQILGMIHDFLRKPVNIYSLNDVIEWQMRYRQLDLEIEEWYKRLPEDIRRPEILKDRENNVMLAMLLSTYYTTVIRLHSSAGYAYLKSEFFTSSPSAAQKCLVAARMVVSIAREVNLLGLWQNLGPQYAFILWVSSRLLLVDCVTNHKSFPIELEFLMSTLHQMGKFWDIAARYWEILTLVIDEELALRKESGGLSTESEESDSKRISSAQILSDMGRNAYALDFLLYKDKDKEKEKDVESKEEGPSKNHSEDKVKSSAISPGPGPGHSFALEPDDVQAMFEWFNWPKPFGADIGTTATPMLHSLDEYKNILSRDEFTDANGILESGEDWLGK